MKFTALWKRKEFATSGSEKVKTCGPGKGLASDQRSEASDEMAAVAWDLSDPVASAAAAKKLQESLI